MLRADISNRWTAASRASADRLTGMRGGRLKIAKVPVGLGDARARLGLVPPVAQRLMHVTGLTEQAQGFMPLLADGRTGRGLADRGLSPGPRYARAGGGRPRCWRW